MKIRPSWLAAVVHATDEYSMNSLKCFWKKGYRNHNGKKIAPPPLSGDGRQGLLVSSIITFNIEFILNVPENLVDSVKILFALTFATFIISVITAIFTTAAFVKNKLYINSLRDIASNTLKLLLVVILFSFFPAKVYFLAMASLASGIFLLLTNIKVKE